MMSSFIVGRLKNCPLDIASPDEVEGLRERLNNALQTQDRDHEIIARLLEFSLVVHPGNATEETLVDLGPDAVCMHVLHCSKTDGAGVAQGHFDLLVPANPDVPERVSLENPLSVSHAISLRGSELAAAVLHRWKDLENRPFSLEGRWIAIHVGKGDTMPSLKAQIKHLVPDLDASGIVKGHIMGLAYVNKSWTVPEYRRMVGCGESCHFDVKNAMTDLPKHSDSCNCSPWVLGPVVNQIHRCLLFVNPIPASGSLGKWPLTPDTLLKVKQIIEKGDFKETTHILGLDGGPYSWPFPWLPPHVHRVPFEYVKEDLSALLKGVMYIYSIYICIFIYIYKHRMRHSDCSYIYIFLFF